MVVRVLLSKVFEWVFNMLQHYASARWLFLAGPNKPMHFSFISLSDRWKSKV